MSHALENLNRLYADNGENKMRVAVILGTSPRSIGRWLSEEHPIPERVVEILTELYGDVSADAEQGEGDVLTDVCLDNTAEKIRDGVLEDMLQNMPADADVSVIMTTIAFKNAPVGYPLTVIAKSIDYREGNQFSLIRCDDGVLVLVNMNNVQNMETQLLSEADDKVKAYNFHRCEMPENHVMINSKDDYCAPKVLDMALNDVVLLRSGKVNRPQNELFLDCQDMNFVILCPELAELF